MVRLSEMLTALGNVLPKGGEVRGFRGLVMPFNIVIFKQSREKSKISIIEHSKRPIVNLVCPVLVNHFEFPIVEVLKGKKQNNPNFLYRIQTNTRYEDSEGRAWQETSTQGGLNRQRDEEQFAKLIVKSKKIDSNAPTIKRLEVEHKIKIKEILITAHYIPIDYIKRYELTQRIVALLKDKFYDQISDYFE
jgi:hypothetical protein